MNLALLLGLSVSNNSPSQSNEEEKKEEGVTIIDDEMSAEEWAKRFDTNTGSNSYTFQFSSTPIEPTPIQPTNQSTPQDIDDDIMRRFKAL